MTRYGSNIKIDIGEASLKITEIDEYFANQVLSDSLTKYELNFTTHNIYFDEYYFIGLVIGEVIFIDNIS